MRLTRVVVCCFVLPFGCSRQEQTLPTKGALSSEKPQTDAAFPPWVTQGDLDDIREATFRHLFHNNASGVQPSMFCIELEKSKDPDGAFLKRFSDEKMPVRPGSTCSLTAAGVIDKQTGTRGLSFRIGSIQWLDPHHVQVRCGYHSTASSASGNLYTLERKGNLWVVEKAVLEWIARSAGRAKLHAAV